MIESSWVSTAGIPIQLKLERCGEDLLCWGKSLSRRFKERIKDCRAQMNSLRSKYDSTSIHQFEEAKRNYNKLLAQQEVFWKQRSKQHWLKEGDCNSRYFHISASARKKRNSISQLKDQNGYWHTWDSGLADLLMSYFKDIFSSRGCVVGEIINSIDTCLSEEQQNFLIAEFTNDEVKEALFSMGPDKAPGPDGINPAFY